MDAWAERFILDVFADNGAPRFSKGEVNCIIFTKFLSLDTTQPRLIRFLPPRAPNHSPLGHRTRWRTIHIRITAIAHVLRIHIRGEGITSVRLFRNSG